ncbi:MAG: twin-arginine translocase TatA/TatE family subunit [Microthrixaceae bacterium]
MLIGGLLGILDSLTGGEVIMILVVVLVLGPERLPETARTMGQWIAKLKAMTGNLQSEVREVLDDPSMKPIRVSASSPRRPARSSSSSRSAAEAEANVAKQVAADAEAAAAEAEAAAARARAAADEAAAEAEEAEQVAEDAAELVEDTPPDEAVPGEPGAGREASIWADLDDDTPRYDAPVDDVTPLVDAPVDDVTPLDDAPLADHGASEST